MHTVKGFGVINKAEIDVFLELSRFLDDPMDDGNLVSGSSALDSDIFFFFKCPNRDFQCLRNLPCNSAIQVQSVIRELTTLLVSQSNEAGEPQLDSQCAATKILCAATKTVCSQIS